MHRWWESLWLLLLYTFIFSVGISLLVLAIDYLGHGASGFFSVGGSRAKVSFMSYAMLAAGTFGTFYLPAVYLQKRESYFNYFPSVGSGKLFFYVLAAGLLFAFSPLMEYIGQWNAGMHLPDSLRGVELWMREQEDSSADLIASIVMVDSVWLVLINILVLAVFPAVAEEYYFRGTLMHIFGRMVNNTHVSIWLTAIIFSAIHVQFFGFFPRMLLGAFFGYLLLWTKNIWVSIVAHFVNNASVTVLAFYYCRQGKSFEDLQSYDNYSVFVYLGSFMVSMVILIYMYKRSKGDKSYGERMD